MSSITSTHKKHINEVVSSFITNEKEEVLVILKHENGYAEVRTYSKVVKELGTGKDTRNLMRNFALSTLTYITQLVPLQSFFPKAFSSGIKPWQNIKAKSTKNPDIQRQLKVREAMFALGGFDPKQGKYVETPYNKKNSGKKG